MTALLLLCARLHLLLKTALLFLRSFASHVPHGPALMYSHYYHFSTPAFSIIGCFVGGTAVLPLVCACGKKLLMSQVVSMSGSCMWCCLFSGLTLLMLRSSACQVDGLVNTSCGLGVGAKLAISSTVLFFITSISMNCTFMTAVITQEMEAQQAEAGAGDDPEEGAGEDK